MDKTTLQGTCNILLAFCSNNFHSWGGLWHAPVYHCQCRGGLTNLRDWSASSVLSGSVGLSPNADDLRKYKQLVINFSSHDVWISLIWPIYAISQYHIMTAIVFSHLTSMNKATGYGTPVKWLLNIRSTKCYEHSRDPQCFICFIFIEKNPWISSHTETDRILFWLFLTCGWTVECWEYVTSPMHSTIVLFEYWRDRDVAS